MRYTFFISDKNARVLDILNEIEGNKSDFICSCILKNYDKPDTQQELIASMQEFFKSIQIASISPASAPAEKPAAEPVELIKEEIIEEPKEAGDKLSDAEKLDIFGGW